MTKYDSNIIQEFADRLYSKAKWIVFKYTVVLGVLFAVGGGALARGSQAESSAFVFFIIGALVGYAIGSEKAFQYKLQAQTALCQCRIEENTRKSF